METDMSDTENTAARIHADALHKIAELEDALAAERAKVEAIAMKEAISAQASGLFAHGLKLETELESLRSKLDAAEAAKQSAEHQLEMEKAGREDDGNSAMMRIKKLSVALDAFRSKLPKTTDGVTVLPGMTLYGFQLTDLNQPKPIAVEGQVIKVFADGFRVDYQIRGFGTPEWYSTAQARDDVVAALSRQEGTP
jgi:hypothetical protein